MSCRAYFGCKTHKSVDPKLGLIEKTGPRPLREGIFYPGCSLLQINPDDGIYEPLAEPDPALIKGALSCDLDTRCYDEPCSAGVILQGCLIADWTFANTPAMPTVAQVVVVDGEECIVHKPLPTPAQFGFTQEEIDAIINCSNCCITFEWLANCQYPLHDEPEAEGKKAVAPKPIESAA